MSSVRAPSLVTRARLGSGRQLIFPGMDLTLEGQAATVTEPALLERVASIYRDIGWPAEVTGDGFTAPYSAPSAGPPPWHLYRFTFHTVVGLSTTEPNGATRWRFGR